MIISDSNMNACFFFSVFLIFPHKKKGGERLNSLSPLCKEPACNAGDIGSISGLQRSPGEGNSYRLQYSGLENSKDSIVHGVIKNQTWLNDFTVKFPLMTLKSLFHPETLIVTTQVFPSRPFFNVCTSIFIKHIF